MNDYKYIYAHINILLKKRNKFNQMLVHLRHKSQIFMYFHGDNWQIIITDEKVTNISAWEKDSILCILRYNVFEGNQKTCLNLDTRKRGIIVILLHEEWT